jgi:hypothetical protein
MGMEETPRFSRERYWRAAKLSVPALALPGLVLATGCVSCFLVVLAVCALLVWRNEVLPWLFRCTPWYRRHASRLFLVATLGGLAASLYPEARVTVAVITIGYLTLEAFIGVSEWRNFDRVHFTDGPSARR